MVINQTTVISNDGGDYLLLTDHGCEGLTVAHQGESMEDAITAMGTTGFGSPQVLVKLVYVEICDCDSGRSA